MQIIFLIWPIYEREYVKSPGHEVMIKSISVILLSSFLAMTLVPLALSSAPAEPAIPKPRFRVSVVIENAPKSVDPGQMVSISWKVEGSWQISHTAVHWDTKHGNPADFRSYSMATPDFAAINPPNEAPAGYTVSFDAPSSGVIYYVVHATVDGAQYYNNDGERSIPVGPRDIGATSGAGETSIDTTVLFSIGILVIIVVAGIVLVRRKKTS